MAPGPWARSPRSAERLRESGISRGDLVVVTARTTPQYLLCWLALATLGAVTVTTDPTATARELAGLAGQVQPRALVTDAALFPLVAEAGLIALQAKQLGITVPLFGGRRAIREGRVGSRARPA